jgi:hypothetical protein
VPGQEELCFYLGIHRLPTFFKLQVEDSNFYVMPRHLSRESEMFSLFISDWFKFGIRGDIPTARNIEEMSYPKEEFHLHNFWVGFSTIVEMLADFMYFKLGLPVLSLDWWTFAVLTLLLNLSPFIFFYSISRQMFAMYKQNEKKKLDDEFVRVEDSAEQTESQAEAVLAQQKSKSKPKSD